MYYRVSFLARNVICSICLLVNTPCNRGLILINIKEGVIKMDKLTAMVAQLTSLTVSLIVLGVAAGVVFGNVPFVGGVLDNALGLVNSLGDAGLVGLLVAGWLMSNMD
jgi:hypothetical protein